MHPIRDRIVERAGAAVLPAQQPARHSGWVVPRPHLGGAEQAAPHIFEANHAIRNRIAAFCDFAGIIPFGVWGA
jgi:hypothetical protein